jgi:hypothetical protein
MIKTQQLDCGKGLHPVGFWINILKKWLNLVTFFMVMILGNVKDEWIFFNLSFMKNKLQNQQIIYFDLIVYMYVHNCYTQKLYGNLCMIIFISNEEQLWLVVTI